MDGILISATNGEQIKVERLFANVVVDRYLTTDLRKQPETKCAISKWVRNAAAYLDQDHVNVQIEVPAVPMQHGNIFDTAANLTNIVIAQTDLINLLLQDDRQVTTTADSDCKVPPDGWRCSRGAGHQGPCAARPYTGTLVDDLSAAVERAEQNAPAERL